MECVLCFEKKELISSNAVGGLRMSLCEDCWIKIADGSGPEVSQNIMNLISGKIGKDGKICKVCGGSCGILNSFGTIKENGEKKLVQMCKECISANLWRK